MHWNDFLSKKKIEKVCTPTGNRTPVSCVTGQVLYPYGYAALTSESHVCVCVVALGKIMRRFFLKICHFLQNSEFFSKWVILLKTWKHGARHQNGVSNLLSFCVTAYLPILRNGRLHGSHLGFWKWQKNISRELYYDCPHVCVWFHVHINFQMWVIS